MSALAPYDDDAEGWAEVGAAIVSDIKAALERRDFKITELEAKYKALEAKSNALEAEVARQRAIIEAMGEVKYCGVWKEGREYLRGNFATIKGATWHADRTTRSRPGAGSPEVTGWTLAVKGF